MLSLLLLFSADAKVPLRDPPPRDGGKALYASSCWQCHGERALGDGPLSSALPSPPLAGRVTASDHDRLIPIVLHGAGDMPGFAPGLTETESRWILIWLATLDPVTGLGPAPAEPDADADADADAEADAEAEEAADEEPVESPSPARASPPPSASPPAD
jgi:mono/diheme cytochrome c family protein